MYIHVGLNLSAPDLAWLGADEALTEEVETVGVVLELVEMVTTAVGVAGEVIWQLA